MTDFELGKTYRWQSDSSDEWFTIRLDREYGTSGSEFQGTVQDKGTFYGNDDFDNWIPDSQTYVTADHLAEIEPKGKRRLAQRVEIQPAQEAVYRHQDDYGRLIYLGFEEVVLVQNFQTYIQYEGEEKKFTGTGVALVNEDGVVLAHRHDGGGK